MGHVFADIELSNPRRADIVSLRTRALADTGALMLCIPEHVALQLALGGCPTYGIGRANRARVDRFGLSHAKFDRLVSPEAAEIRVGAHPETKSDSLLETESEREVSVADGRRRKVPYVGPVKVAFGQRFCYVGALVLGDEVLLGAVSMEDMDLLVLPGRRELTVDPQSPNIPHARVKTMLENQ